MARFMLIFLLFAAAAYGQWPASPDSNLAVCTHTGEQTIPKVAAYANGTYISWYDHAGTNYDLYLQRLDMNGVPQWAAGGMLISSHPQETWLTDYDLTVDSAGYAILVFNDIRAGGDWDIYAYRISPTGQFSWGADGLTLSNNADFEATPRVCVLMDGDHYAFTWEDETSTGIVAKVRVVDVNGTDLFPEVTLTSQYGVWFPHVAATTDGDFIVLYLKQQGSQFTSPKHIYAQKFNLQGQAQWAANGVPVMTTNGIGPAMQADLVSDGLGGAIVYWYDTRDNNRHHVWVQRILSNGTMGLTVNGVQTVTTANQLQMSPAMAFVPDLGRVMLFYMISDLNQTVWGIGGQAIDSMGNRLWGNDGITLVAQDAAQRFSLLAFPQSYGATLIYLESAGGTNDLIKAFGVRGDGGLQWENSPRMMCSVNSSKLHLAAGKNAFGQTIAAWGDGRVTGDDIYAQNINSDGSLGNTTPPQPTIRITWPPDSTVIGDGPIQDPAYLRFDIHNFVVSPTGGDGLIELRTTRFGITDTFYYSTADSILIEMRFLSAYYALITLELVHYNHSPLSSRAMDSVHLAHEASANDLPSGLPNKFALSPAYPNPFNPQTTLEFALPHAGWVTLTVYDLTGREIKTLVNGTLPAGRHNVAFDASGLPSGIYLCRMTSGNFSAVQKMMLLK